MTYFRDEQGRVHRSDRHEDDDDGEPSQGPRVVTVIHDLRGVALDELADCCARNRDEETP